MATRTTATPARAPIDDAESRVPTTGAAIALYFVLALVYFLPALLPGQHIYGTDYFAGGYFFYDFVAERLTSGELPRWVPYIFGGLPLFANPGSAYQPVHLLASLLLPTSKILAAVFLIHFWLAGVGGFLLAVELGCRRWIAFVAGIAFQFTGMIASWVYAGHDGRVIVATLAPLFFYLLRRGIRTGRVAPFAGAAATLGAALLSFQIQNAYYLLLAAAIWAVFSLVQLGVVRDRPRLARVVALGLGAVAFGFLLAAVNFLPFVDYIDQSPRGAEGGRGYEYSTSYSLPEGELLSLAVPEANGASIADPLTGEPLFPAYHGENPFKLHTEYVGAFALVLLALGAFYSRRDRTWWFFAGLGLFMLTIALGGHTPIYRLYYAVLPGTKQFRAPSLSFYLVAMSLAMMAALTLERIAVLRREALDRRGGTPASALDRLPWIAGGVVAVAGLGFMLSAGDPGAQPGFPSASQGWARFAVFAGLVAAALWMWTRGRIGTVAAAVALALITTADLWVIGKRFLHTTDPPEVTFAADDVMAFLAARPGPSRVWTFPLPQQYRSGGPYGGDYPMLFGIEQVGGEHPNPLRTWVEYLGAGTQTYIDWHNVLTAPEIVETPSGQAIAFQGHDALLNAAGVRYVVSMAPLAHPSLREVHRGSALIYENTAALPRAYLVPQAETVTGDGALAAMTANGWDPLEIAFVTDPPEPIALPAGPFAGEAAVVEHRPDRVVVRASASRPALLVLADNYYDGWEARVNGAPAPVVRANHTFRGVVVPAGEHTVEFTFEPADLETGLLISVAGALLLIGFGVATVVRGRRERAASA